MTGLRRRSLATCVLCLLLAPELATAQAPPPTDSNESTEAQSAQVEPAEVEAEPTDIAAVDDDEVAAAFARMDSDRDGQLSLQEFVRGIARPYGSRGEGVVYQRLPARFRALDIDASGYLEAAEFAALAQRWRGPGPAPTALAHADRSGDGRIDFREFALLHAPPDAGARDANTAKSDAEAAAPAATDLRR